MIIIERRAPLDAMRETEPLTGSLFTNESGGHKFVITCVTGRGKDLETVPLLSGSVTGRFFRPDHTAVELTPAYAGIDADGRAWVVLPANCYTQTGAFGLVITWIDEDENRSVIYSAAGYVRAGEASEIVDPENIINVDAIQDMIDAMAAATSAATAAAAFVPEIIAHPYSPSATYVLGDYVIKNYLYYCFSPVNTPGTWESNKGHFVRVYVSEDMKDFRQALGTKAAVSDTDASGPDLDITDGSGNVIVRFADGNLETKYFKSVNVQYMSHSEPVDGDHGDLLITDSAGNALVQFSGGNIRVKNFDSALCARDWRGKKWCCVGDSLTEKNIRSDLVYHDYVAARTGIAVTNLGHSGAGYYYRGYSYGFRDQVGRVPTDSDVVTIFGSGNDCYSDSAPLGDVTDTGETTVCGCINKTLSLLYARCPAVNLGIITPTPWYLSSGTRDWSPLNPGNVMELYCEAIVEICRRNSIPCLDLYHMSNLRPYDADFRTLIYSKDEGNGVHPNEQGHALIAARFQAFLDTLLLH
ncbi:MAG: SGNH/GDSL hydrolase family protein [Oscillospiraceae bacterium]|nr:SGNH/GDSL hydrolase family protein [Oscillospiraceae bacterium]